MEQLVATLENEMLDHLKVSKRNIADRYVLGELSKAEREEFEEHYFECTECAEDVRAFLAISSNSKSVLFDVQDCQEPVAARGWTPMDWLQALRAWRPRAIYAMAPALAMLALTVTTTWQSIALRSHLVAQAVPQFALRPDARGEETEIGVQKLAHFLLLTADVPGNPRVVTWQIRRLGSQTPLMEETAPGPKGGVSLSIMIPASKLSTGQYILVIRPGEISPTITAETVYRFRMH